MTTYSASAISTGFDAVTGIIVWKFVNWVALSFIDLSTIVSNLSGVLPTFIYDPLYWLIAAPLQTAAGYAAITYGDLMSLMLLHFVGTTYDPTNPFCYVMFFIVPLYRIFDQIYFYLTTNVSYLIGLIQASSSVSDYIYRTAYAFLLTGLSTLYVTGSMLVTGEIYYSYLL